MRSGSFRKEMNLETDLGICFDYGCLVLCGPSRMRTKYVCMCVCTCACINYMHTYTKIYVYTYGYI